MRQPFCILEVFGDVLDDGELRLIETANTLIDARHRVEILAELRPGRYVIYDAETGERVSLVAEIEN